jgi:nicotinamidase-related amidase
VRKPAAHTNERGVGRRGTALLLIDVINAFDFDGSENILRAAKRAAPKIEQLAARARRRDVPVIYVNDNFGRWRSDFKSTVAACTQPGKPGREIAERLRPHDGDYFVLKPQHSGFYFTALELLLRHLDVRSLVLTGFAGNICVLFTANDAHMRGYHVVVPRNCTASNTPALNRSALMHVEIALHGDARSSTTIDFAKLARLPRKPRGQTF